MCKLWGRGEGDGYINFNGYDDVKYLATKRPRGEVRK